MKLRDAIRKSRPETPNRQPEHMSTSTGVPDGQEPVFGRMNGKSVTLS